MGSITRYLMNMAAADLIARRSAKQGLPTRCRVIKAVWAEKFWVRKWSVAMGALRRVRHRLPVNHGLTLDDASRSRLPKL